MCNNIFQMKARIKNEIKHFTNLNHIWWGALTYAGQRRYDIKFAWFKKLCKPNKDKRILEVGCGDGEFTSRLASLNSRIVGTDITPSLISKAKTNFKSNKNTQFMVDDCESMQ